MCAVVTVPHLIGLQPPSVPAKSTIIPVGYHPTTNTAPFPSSMTAATPKAGLPGLTTAAGVDGVVPLPKRLLPHAIHTGWTDDGKAT